MKRNKTIKSLLAVLLSLTMVLGMSLTAFAAEKTSTPAEGTANDTTTVTITGLTGKENPPTVTLYQIASGDYDANAAAGVFAFKDFIWITDTQPEFTADSITAIVNSIKDGSLSAATVDGTTSAAGAAVDGITPYTFTATVGAGAYIAVITGGDDGAVYNPILLSASYSENGSALEGGTVGTGDKYLEGTTAVAKKTNPGVDKKITGGTVPDDYNNETKDTASVGSIVKYEADVTIPSYPLNAKNKTLFLSDIMTEGLTFNADSIEIDFGDAEVVKDGNTFRIGDKVIATVSTDGINGFYMNFNYLNLISDEDTGATYSDTITVKYSATVNEDAVVGVVGNPNTATLYYANDPTTGETWEPSEGNPTPANADGVTSKDDTEIVYTYQVAFSKTGADTDGDGEPNPLAGAIFGIYSNNECTVLVDKVVTNGDGYAVSTNVGKGTYYVKEIKAPAGYSLNTTVYTVETTWATATKTVTGVVTDRTWTSTKPSDDAVQVGWIKRANAEDQNGVFCELDEYDVETELILPAYIANENATTTTATEITENAVGAGTAMLADIIPNTQLASLPSTGGIGTFVFTIGGCLIMVAAAVLLLTNRKKTND